MHRRCPDEQGIVVEMIKHAGNLIHEELLALYNDIIDTAQSPAEWHRILFTTH